MKMSPHDISAVVGFFARGIAAKEAGGVAPVAVTRKIMICFNPNLTHPNHEIV